MKRNLLRFFVGGIIAFCCLPVANAYDFVSDGVYYDIISGSTNVMVTYKDKNYNSYSGDVVIPSTVTNNGTTYTVTALGKYSIRNSAQLTSIILPESLKEIQMGSFSKCNALIKLTVPNSVETIGNLAIQDNPNLKELVLGTGVKTIGTGAFMGNVALTKIEIPKGVTEISSNVFANCIGLTTVNIPENVAKINGTAFAGCINLKNFTVDPANTKFVAVDGVLFSKDKTVLAVYPGGRTESEFTVPEGVKELGFKAFSQRCITVKGSEFYDTSLKTIKLPSSLEVLGNSCFQYLVAMESIDIPDKVNVVGNQTFAQCTALKSIALPASVEKIDISAFSGCTSLKDVTLGSGLTSIGASAFKGDSALEKVKCSAAIPPVCKSTSFDATVSSATLIVPEASVGAYKEADAWKTFGTIKASDGAGIGSVETDLNVEVREIYNVNGVRLAEPQSGLNIMKMSDGTVRKVMLK